MLNQFYCIFTKELSSYFRTNLAYFILIIYVVLSMLTTFYIGYFFALNNSELFSFFYFQPDIFTVLIPALTMRLWAEERKNSTAELLLTQPINYTTVVVSKFCASWCMCLIMLLLTIPFWIYASSLMELDNVNIISKYISCILVSGAFCAVGCLISSFNNSPIVAYIVSVFATWGIIIGNFDFLLSSASSVSNELWIRSIQSLNFSKHYGEIINGQIGFDNIIYFVTIILFALWFNVISIEYKKK